MWVKLTPFYISKEVVEGIETTLCMVIFSMLSHITSAVAHIIVNWTTVRRLMLRLRGIISAMSSVLRLAITPTASVIVTSGCCS